jgi:predicted transcriptional regulator
MDNKKKLKELLRKKRQQRKQNALETSFDELTTEGTDIVSMMRQVNKILQTNPQMVKQISKCVSNVMENKEIMESLTSQLNQTLPSNSEGESSAAVEKESTQ